eukprot:TRINITY_DN3433_c2_g1_i1.p1 TRINITY_DN3433_c2_g1~~TRINITY_DN3433_c2_g1_i1.p1  ORF type:complete len:291 (-),score=105.40 TRINITY_DN3433_c2_g1_i1:49-810(-)
MNQGMGGPILYTFTPSTTENTRIVGNQTVLMPSVVVRQWNILSSNALGTCNGGGGYNFTDHNCDDSDGVDDERSDSEVYDGASTATYPSTDTMSNESDDYRSDSDWSETEYWSDGSESYRSDSGSEESRTNSDDDDGDDGGDVDVDYFVKMTLLGSDFDIAPTNDIIVVGTPKLLRIDGNNDDDDDDDDDDGDDDSSSSGDESDDSRGFKKREEEGRERERSEERSEQGDRGGARRWQTADVDGRVRGICLRK